MTTETIRLAGRPHAVALDFTNAFSKAEQKNAAGTDLQLAVSGGVARKAIAQHPGAPGAPLTELTWPEVALPFIGNGEKLLLHFYIGLRDGADLGKQSQADGCDFVIRVAGEEVFRRAHRTQAWEECAADLSRYASQSLAVSFVVDPRGNSAYDWAVWGDPQLIIDGRRADDPSVAAAALPKFWKTADLLARPAPDRIVAETAETGEGGAPDGGRSSRSVTLVAVLDENLDLPTQMRRMGPRNPPPVALGPALVVGEGEDPANHTVVRILDRYGLAEFQFLAYPPDVTGGVQVLAAADRRPGDAKDEVLIVAAPLASTATGEVRLFTRHGGDAGAFTPDPAPAPPYVLATGEFVPGNPGDEIALAGRNQPAQGRAVHFYSLGGKLLKTVALPDGKAGPLALSTKHNGMDHLVAFFPVERKACLVDAATGVGKTLELPLLAGATGLYETAFNGGDFLATGPEPLLSTVKVIPPSLRPETRDVGALENRFWICWPAAMKNLPAASSAGGAGPKTVENRHVQLAVYRHTRTDMASPGAAAPRFGDDDPAFWAGGEFMKRVDRDLKKLSGQPYTMWEPCYTHRIGKGSAVPWFAAVDPVTGYPTRAKLAELDLGWLAGECSAESLRR
ncbi:MAG: hypothetical protein M1457_01560 [bacterium]|nr:hypothetical protein [bacterium]